MVFLRDVGTRARVLSSRKFLCLGFSRSLKATKRWWARFGLSFAVVNINKMIFVIKLKLHEGRRSQVIIWFCLLFSSICFGEISQNFHNLGNLSCQSFKSRKNRGYKGNFLAFCNVVFSSSISNLVFLNFFTHQSSGRAQICLTVQHILGNSTEGNATNLTR